MLIVITLESVVKTILLCLALVFMQLSFFDLLFIAVATDVLQNLIVRQLGWEQ